MVRKKETTLEEVVVDQCPQIAELFLTKEKSRLQYIQSWMKKIWQNDQSAKVIGDSKLFSPAEKLSVMEKFSLASNPPSFDNSSQHLTVCLRNLSQYLSQRLY